MKWFAPSLMFILLLALLSACGGNTASGTTDSAARSATADAASPIATQRSGVTNSSAPSAAATKQTTLNVFAAASLTEAFGAIGKQFEAAHPGVSIAFNFAGSQQLAQQIGQGAPVDVFASANMKQMDVVVQSGQVISGTQRTFARNRLVVIHPKDNRAGINTLKDLAKPGVKIDLAAKAVPVGQYALDVLAKASNDPAYGASFQADVLKNVVSYEENVKAVLSKVALGEADAGVVYTSDISRNTAAKIGQIPIPDTLNTIAAYPIAPIKGSQNAALAQQFVEYVLSPEGQAILTSYGFLAADQAADRDQTSRANSSLLPL